MSITSSSSGTAYGTRDLGSGITQTWRSSETAHRMLRMPDSLARVNNAKLVESFKSSLSDARSAFYSFDNSSGWMKGSRFGSWKNLMSRAGFSPA
jgi:hypothetical protein